MKLKLLVLTFLIMVLAVTPVFATPAYDIHTSKDLPLHGNTFYFFGGGCYIRTTMWPIIATAFFETSGSYSWFNCTESLGADTLYVYNSLWDVAKVYLDNVEYPEDTPAWDFEWSESYGTVVAITHNPLSFPVDISIAYNIPPPPEMVSITVSGTCYNASSGLWQDVTGTEITVELADSGDPTTFMLPTMFSILKGTTYTLTASSSGDWTFDHWTYFGAYYTNETEIRLTFQYDTSLGVVYTAVEPYNLLPIPIIFIFGMVGLGCMFVGPSYAINKIKQKEYRSGLVWGVIITALGFALFIAWLFGGNF